MNYCCYVMFNKRAGVFYRGIKPRLQKHPTKSMSLGSPNKGSNCEGIILAYKKNKLCLIRILYCCEASVASVAAVHNLNIKGR